MKNTFGLFIFLCFSFYAAAQDTIQPVDLDEVLIFSGKFAEKRKNIVQKIDVVTAKRIELLNVQNTGDLLMHSGNVFVQKSQQGGSSPVIRGFEASRVLLVIDGIRMNNAIYRSGHLQNVISVDQNMLENIEILYGPSSTLYGSDALGGVVHMRTKLPKLSSTGKWASSGSAFTRYSSANHEKTAHLDLSLGNKKFAWLQSYNFSDFSDLRTGSHDHPDYPGFGRRNTYITTFNGMDSIVQNSDNRIQKFSGYRQWDITQKLLFQQNSNTTHLLNLQFSNATNIPRYDRLQDTRNGILRFAEWYYGPPERWLAAYEFNKNNFLFFEEFKTILSYQKIKESRHQRNYRSALRANRFENVGVTAVTVDGRKRWKAHELTIGTDAQFNQVGSTAFSEQINTGARTALDTRYPDGINNMLLAGIYAQHLVKMSNGKWVLNDGLRLQYTKLRSTIVDNSFFNFPFTSIDQENLAITGNIGIIYMPNLHWRFTTGLSTGFRSPNIDDLGKIFESNSASAQLILPNPSIKPEFTYNADLNISYRIPVVHIETGIFFTRFQNAIALAPFMFNGEDSMMFNGVMAAVFANQNVNKGRLWGYHAGITISLSQAINLSSNVNYTNGRLFPFTGNEIPMDHIPPVYGRAALSYARPLLNAELYLLFNGWKKIKDYNPAGEDNAQYATPDGTPSWQTLNIKTSIYKNKWVIQTGIENILDRNYRLFASGFSSAGRNFIFALRYKI